MLPPHPTCPDPGQPTQDRVLRSLAARWASWRELDDQIDRHLIEAKDLGVSLRLIHTRAGIPRSTASDRIRRHLTPSTAGETAGAA